jgi:transcription elongation factor/antiterminator RfaH
VPFAALGVFLIRVRPPRPRRENAAARRSPIDKVFGKHAMPSSQLVRSWYVLHTRSRFENVVNEGLLKKSIEVFLPRITVPSTRRDRKLMIRVPLFPGYIFVRTNLDPNEHLEIVKTIGAVRLIGTKDGPVPVAAETIQSLQIMVASDLSIVTGSRLRRGDRVMVINGPLVGLTGVFVSYRGKGRVVVNVDALGQFAGVEVAAEDVEKIPQILT